MEEMMKKDEIELVEAEEVLPAVPDGPPQLTEAQERFCRLYVCGGMQYAGQADRCYKEVFGKECGKDVTAVRSLTRNPSVVARIRELGAEMLSESESIAMKMQISETLKAVMRETSSGIYRDRFGNPLSPAPLRAVAVNAAKALMEMHPVKNGGEAKFRIEGNDNNIVFNVIVPRMENTPAHDEEG